MARVAALAMSFLAYSLYLGLVPPSSHYLWCLRLDIPECEIRNIT